MILPPVKEERVTRTTIGLQEPARLAEQADERKWVLVPPSVAAQYWTWIISQAFAAPQRGTD